MSRSLIFTVLLLSIASVARSQSAVKIATFEVDASPPVGSPLAYDSTRGVESPLSLRGIIILTEPKPMVLCSIDWLGVANQAQTEFKQALAEATGTTPDRIAIHAVHQHDAPRCDFSAEKILAEHGHAKKSYDVAFCRKVIRAAATAATAGIQSANVVTHIGVGKAEVKHVASNRRILGSDGKVKVTRYTATKDPAVRALPVGTIDPDLRLISFWHEEEPVAVLSFYATHPQSYYRTGLANPDFPGIARNSRQKKTGIPHIHFNGAGGNIGAGKWNDGSRANRPRLAERMEQGMEDAWKNTKKSPIESVTWKKTDVLLPIGRALVEEQLLDTLKNKQESQLNLLYAAKHLAWLRRSKAKKPIQVSCLTINHAKILLMPGELFVEYQLHAQELDPDSFVAMAAYGEYGMGYIGTAISYSQGGYETSARASRVGPGSEKVLMKAIRELLGK